MKVVVVLLWGILYPLLAYSFPGHIAVLDLGLDAESAITGLLLV